MTMNGTTTILHQAPFRGLVAWGSNLSNVTVRFPKEYTKQSRTVQPLFEHLDASTPVWLILVRLPEWSERR